MSKQPSMMWLLVLALLLAWNGMALAQTANVADGISAKLRANASRYSTAIAVLPPGTSVEIHETKGEYASVSAAGKKGWVAQRLLRVKKTPQAMAVSKAALLSVPDDDWKQESQIRQNELAMVREEQEKNTWRMLATTIGVAIAAFLSGFWLRGVIFRQRYGWLSVSDHYRAMRKNRHEIT